MELDFNKKLEFKEEDFVSYEVDVIFQNIDDFMEFIRPKLVTKNFERVFESAVFQITLIDEDTRYLENLMAVYNGIATGNLLGGSPIPPITKKDMLQQLRLRGYSTRRGSAKMFKGVYKNVTKVYKEEERIWK